MDLQAASLKMKISYCPWMADDILMPTSLADFLEYDEAADTVA